MVLVSSETVGLVRWRKKEVRVAAMDGGREHETEMLSGRSYGGNLEGTENLWWKMGFWFSRICLLLQILSSSLLSVGLIVMAMTMLSSLLLNYKLVFQFYCLFKIHF